MARLLALRVLLLVVVAVLGLSCASSEVGPPPTESPLRVSSPSTGTPPSPRATEAPKFTVPKVIGLTLAKARSLLEARGFDVAVKRKVSKTKRPGTVLTQSPKAGRRLEAGRRVTITVAKKPPNPCDPNYAGQCLDPNAYDYDCGGGSGDGPKYVYGTVQVVGYDHYDLDRDGDGIGCE